MAKITFSKLCSEFGLKTNTSTVPLGTESNLQLNVRNYLPVKEKADLLQFVVDGALDEATGCFSPLRVEVYFGIAICKWYAGISFTAKQLTNIGDTYDILDSNKIITDIVNCIPEEEFTFISDLVNDTVKDIARYNNSAAGIIQNMTNGATNLDEQLTDILEKIKNKEGTPNLETITEVVGKD